MCNALRTRMVPGDQSVAKSSRFLGLTMLSCGQVAIVSPCGSGLMLPVSAGNIPMAMFSRVVFAESVVAEHGGPSLLERCGHVFEQWFRHGRVCVRDASKREHCCPGHVWGFFLIQAHCEVLIVKKTNGYGTVKCAYEQATRQCASTRTVLPTVSAAR